MHSKLHQFLLAALFAATPFLANAEATQPEIPKTPAASEPVESGEGVVLANTEAPAPVAAVEVSQSELLEIVGYLTAQGSGIASLELEDASIEALAEALEKVLRGELNLMQFEQSEVEAAFAEAQARAEALQAGSEDVPAITPAALEKIGAVIVMQAELKKLGFGKDDAETIGTGFVAGSKDKEPDPALEAKIPAFQKFIQSRVQAAQAKMMASQAAAQKAVMAEFEETAAEWRAKENFNVALETTQGTIEIELFPRIAPLAVANFVGHIKSGYYEGLIFHRVIDGFMIQGGDPLGTGTGGESIWNKNFPDEFSPEVRFDTEGLLAMANSGPMTNGSQFFITTSQPEWLNDKHTIFGKVVKGYETVVKIEKTETDAQNKPIKAQKILKAYIVE